MDMQICPACDSKFVYEVNSFYHCPECGKEWHVDVTTEDGSTVLDVYGTLIRDGDDVIVIKDLKVKGKSLVVKQGTKVRGIKIVSGDHNIDCRIDGIGQMSLKSEFVKKA